MNNHDRLADAYATHEYWRGRAEALSGTPATEPAQQTTSDKTETELTESITEIRLKAAYWRGQADAHEELRAHKPTITNNTNEQSSNLPAILLKGLAAAAKQR